MIECWLYWNLQYHGHRHIILEQTLGNLMGLHCSSLADNITGYWHDQTICTELIWNGTSEPMQTELYQNQP